MIEHGSYVLYVTKQATSFSSCIISSVCFLLLLSSFTCSAKDYKGISAPSCITLDKKLSAIQSQMRLGYSAKQGEKLRAKERALIKKRAACKKKKLPTSK